MTIMINLLALCIDKYMWDSVGLRKTVTLNNQFRKVTLKHF